MQRRVRVFVLKKVSVRLVYHLCILRDAIIAVTVAVVSLTGIVQEGNDADLFIGKRYIQLVTFITELVPQKVNKKKETASIALKILWEKETRAGNSCHPVTVELLASVSKQV